MTRATARVLCCILLPIAFFASTNVYGQNEREAPPNRPEYDSRFFDQLRTLFGRFRDADLKRAFDNAVAIPCSELVDDKGEWRSVAFFNEDRRLGDWYRDNLDEVKADPAVYIFKGTCRGDRTSVQLTTKFPVLESVDQYNAHKIRFDQIAVNVNAPVSVLYDYPTEAYTFELPYLFRSDDGKGGRDTYSLTPQTFAERNRYAPNVTNLWDCKNVKAADVTYQFLICRTQLVARNASERSSRDDSFGSSAYFILSDGKEASARVTFSFDTDGSSPPPTVSSAPESSPPPATTSAPTPPPENRTGGDDRGGRNLPDVRPPSAKPFNAWKSPAPSTKLVDIGDSEFRFQFNLQTWIGKLESPQLLSDEKMSDMAKTRVPSGADSCVWRPGEASSLDRLLATEPDQFVTYSMKEEDKLGPIPVSITFDMKTHTGLPLGTLQCSFPHAIKASEITFERWVATVGGHLILQISQ